MFLSLASLVLIIRNIVWYSIFSFRIFSMCLLRISRTSWSSWSSFWNSSVIRAMISSRRARLLLEQDLAFFLQIAEDEEPQVFDLILVQPHIPYKIH